MVPILVDKRTLVILCVCTRPLIPQDILPAQSNRVNKITLTHMEKVGAKLEISDIIVTRLPSLEDTVAKIYLWLVGNP